MSRRRRALMVGALVLCTSCSTLMPNTAAAIAPATFTDVAISAAADVEQWLQFALLFVGI